MSGRLIPNFYSPSLCRKNNACHLRKQRPPRAAAEGAVDRAAASGIVAPPSSTISSTLQEDTAAAVAVVVADAHAPRPPSHSVPQVRQELVRVAAELLRRALGLSNKVEREVAASTQRQLFRDATAMRMLTQHRFSDFLVYHGEHPVVRSCSVFSSRPFVN